MNKKDYIELLDRFFKGLTSVEENNALKEWFVKPGSKEVFDEYYAQCWQLATNEIDPAVQDEMLSYLLEEINKPALKQTTPKKVRNPFSPLRYIAACACAAALTIGAYFVGMHHNAPDNNPVAMTVENGQKADIVLSDGTRVFLNSGSKIIYDGTYNKKNRNLTLEGEAYFEVARNEKIPFIVKAKGLEIEALGTSFNVKAHKNDDVASVILIEGKVRVAYAESDIEEILSPNDRLEYSYANASFTKSEMHPNADFLLWRSNELAFYGDSLEEICQTLTRMYDWSFVFASDEVKNFTYNGVIRNNSLANVLSVISQLTPVKFEIKPEYNKILVSEK